ncbi:unnamed protein product [Cuscuta europaea]|uniref:2Fe-2S ferredoxin-type domain-containing protein n=1 Tax=Cuscuta europaea TaxID=41803 RepID=A0A9P0ZXA6_CUSEU|nr:unnamed protein product [Cuscuta europaea]
MDLLAPCNACYPLHRRATFHAPLNFPPNSTKCSRKTTFELQAPGAVAAQNGTSNSIPNIPTHKVTVHDRQSGAVHEFFVSEDQYILHTAEAQNIRLPFACRHGCCTSCAVRVKSGKIRQPEALGISNELKKKVVWKCLRSNISLNIKLMQ